MPSLRELLGTVPCDGYLLILSMLRCYAGADRHYSLTLWGRPSMYDCSLHMDGYELIEFGIPDGDLPAT